MYKDYNIIIGIDTGVNTGVCIYSRLTRKIEWLACLPIHRALAMTLVQYTASRRKLLVRVEDARLRKYIPRQKTEREELAKAAGAGSVKRDAKIWEDFLKDEGIPYELVAPKNNKTKIKAVFFKRLTRWEGSTNEHARDAAMLCWGL